jgi:hypothetical protein
MKNAKKRGRKQHMNATCQNDFDLGYFYCVFTLMNNAKI